MTIFSKPDKIPIPFSSKPFYMKKRYMEMVSLHEVFDTISYNFETLY